MTLFREAEYIMNCRPLGKNISDDDDVEALRPIDLMTGFLKPSDEILPPNDITFEDKFRRGYIYTRRLAEEWWDRWLRRYHAVLLECQKWTEPQQNLREGDLVLLLDASTPPVAGLQTRSILKSSSSSSSQKICKSEFEFKFFKFQFFEFDFFKFQFFEFENTK